MLRRQPTKITLIQDDIIAYDKLKAQKDAKKRKQDIFDAAGAGKSTNFGNTPSNLDVFGRKDTRSRDQRIGI